MAWLSLMIGGLLVLAMIGVSVYGWLKLPADVKIPVHHGLGSYNNYRSKAVGLLTWPGIGVLLYGILAAVAGHALQPNHASRSTALVILLAALVTVTVFQIGAVRAAGRGT